MKGVLKAKKLAPGANSFVDVLGAGASGARTSTGTASGSRTGTGTAPASSRHRSDPASAYDIPPSHKRDRGSEGDGSKETTSEDSSKESPVAESSASARGSSYHSGEEEPEKPEEDPGHWLLDHKCFTATVYALIFSNSLQMGLSVDYDFAPWDSLWLFAEYFFTIAFTIEMVLKLGILKPKAYFSLGWNCLDCFLVTMSIIDIFIGVLFDGDSPLGDMSILRTLRILRVMRIARLLKVFKELWMIIKGIIDSLQTMFWVSMLLTLILYCTAILCVDVVGRNGTNTYPASSDSKDVIEGSESIAGFNNYLYFGTIGRSMYTLFCLATLLEFPEFARPIMERQPEMILLFLVFIIFTSFGIMNVIIGVIVDNTMEAAQAMQKEDDAKEKAKKLVLLESIRTMVFALDEDNSGTISTEELEKGLVLPEVRDCLEMVDLPKGFDAQEILSLLDNDGDGMLDFGEFMWSFFRLIDNDSFQGSCMMHASLNELKRDLLLMTEESKGSFSKIDECLAEVEMGMEHSEFD